MKSIKELEYTAAKLRLEIFEMVVKANGGHLGGAFSVIDVLTVLYKNVLNNTVCCYNGILF